ncbi:MAG: Iron-sulfur cluster assembly ATPase protein SufC, partial [uncultured Solirubrobacterales bacterium]
PRRDLHGLPVPGDHPRRLGGQLPAHGGQRRARGGDQGQGVRSDPAQEHGPAQDRPGVHQALPQRGLLGRREEAGRDPPDGHAPARDRRARRDRLRARRRRAADRLRGRERDARARPRRADHHSLHAHPQLHPAGLRAHHARRADRARRRLRARRPARGRGLRGRARGGGRECRL